MCIKAVGAVLKAPIEPPTLKLTAVVLANALNGKTRQLNLGLTAIALDVGVNRRQAQRCVRALIDRGLLSVVANAYGGKPGTTPHYRLHLDRIAQMVRTGVADDTPTDDTSATPQAAATGDTQDADGCHTGHRGVTSKVERGGVQTTQTGRNRKEPERNRVAEAGQQLDAFPSALSADAEAPPKVPKVSKVKAPTKTGPTWDAYRTAYSLRYGVQPVSNAKVNGQLSRFVDRLGADEAPQVARFYVEHPGQFYASKAHTVDWMLSDAEKLRTEWATGRIAAHAGGGRHQPEGVLPHNSTPEQLAKFTDGLERRLFGSRAIAVVEALPVGVTRRLSGPSTWLDGEDAHAREL